MSMKHDAANGNYTSIATKIAWADKVRLLRIAEGFGMSLYEMMQGLLLAMARYFDKGSIVTDEGNSLLNALGNVMFASKDSFSPMALKGRQQQRVCSAILFMQRNGSLRPQLMEAQIDRQGNIVESYNYDDMLSAFLNCLDPDALQRLKVEAKKQGYFSITQTLHELIMQRTANTTAYDMSAEVRELFTDERIATGQKTNNDIHYKAKQNRGNDYTTITPRKAYKADL